MRTQIALTRVAVLALLGLVTACGAEAPTTAADTSAAAGFPMTFTTCGREVTLQRRPERVLTIGPSAVALLHAAGASGAVAARAGEFGTPASGPAGAAVESVPLITDEDPTTEAILGAGVDAVIGYGLFRSSPEELASSGIVTIVNQGECGHDGGGAETATTFDDVYADIRTYGRIFGTTDMAEARVAALRGRVDEVAEQRSSATPLTAATVYFFAASSAPSAYGGSSMNHAQLTMAGLQNVFGDLPQRFADISIEQLLDRDPEVIVLGYGFSGETFEQARQRLLSLPGAATLRAVRNDRIVALPANQVGPDPGAVDGLDTIARAVAAW